MTDRDITELLRHIFKDIEVELKEEFDSNFDRQSFFGEAWQRRKSPIKGDNRAILVNSGALRRSLRTKRIAGGVSFDYDKEYASIHNDGGNVKVTERMKRFFWAKYYETSGSFGRRRDGSLRRDKRTIRLVTEAEFWKLMALKPVGSAIKIPKRQFIGDHPKVDESVNAIIRENVEQFIKDNFGDIKEEIKI